MKLALGGMRSIRIPDPDRLAALDRADCIAIVGSTCTGKTTLVNAIRRSALHATGRIDVPMRYLTRPPRGGDDAHENTYLTEHAFVARVAARSIAIAWRREIEPGRSVSYGFAPPRVGTLAVYSANNAVFAPDAELVPRDALASALLIGVVVPDALRAERLRNRSPDLWTRPGEVARRLEDRAASVAEHVHLAIHNHGDLEAVAPGELVRLVEHLVAGQGSHG